MTLIKEPKKWYVKLFTLGKNFSSRTFSDNSKKFLLNAVGLFVVVTFTFYVENLGDEYETKKKYVELVKEINGGLENILNYSKSYKEQIDWYSEMYQKQYNKWEIDNDSIFIDFQEDDEGLDGKYYFAPMAFFENYDQFAPPILGFEIFKSGNQDFKMVDKFTTSIISDIMEGFDLKYLEENTNVYEKEIVKEYRIILKKWTEKIDVTTKDDNQFWIQNRKYIQNDNELKYLLKSRMDLWTYDIEEEIDIYMKNVENDQKLLDSMINIFENEKYFLYWKIN
ncbi:hypothetical protein N9I41_05380 [Flavobacteriaceae bacterium]|nr:hypothetical protein [Flavobacteriaceae bacterium]